ncbi:uncharacterized protein LOC123410946 [Hordeum vulgare subsp. vulgare]|uniref:uncharacterized protein LOC123410946 n=1 Tax=Hordeum vulgare subsp. vulgare TaxID=112509 RepID=UPI000296AC89|nr:uncharacterized protein LOC123410946 [Hordeum vulgare subsp. vulgare]KAI5017653.1 hypothetical protein ZWY2020_042541 [Hordeum vulgare]
MARVSRTTPNAAASSRTKETAAAAPKSRSKKTPAAPRSRTKKTPPAATPPSPSPAPANPTAPAPANPTAPAPDLEVIEIFDFPTPSVSSGNRKRDRKRAGTTASSPLDVDEIEMWTPRQNRRFDDDCLILSADPLAANKARPVVVPAAGADEDLAVLAERGPVACRDFPHARYLCVKFPFATTPHEKHCEQCYCFVCDVAAPCATWRGHANYGHCHASDQDKIWKTMRGAKKANTCKTY